jgi:hypothetical protein
MCRRARAGMHDHLGGGFHRYSTDAAWHVPHFEKMLYDQAQLAMAYSDAYQITRQSFFAGIARDILEYVLRDMRGAEGGFYSAENADSAVEEGQAELVEGAFYVFTAGEIREVLGAERAALFNFRYGVEPSGNVLAQQDIQGELKGKNVLIVRHTLAETAAKFGKSQDAIRAALEAATQRLAAARAGRPRPSLDDKVLVAWNGLMISAFARAAQVLDEPRYLAAAKAAAAFVESRLYDDETHRLERRYRDGHADIDGVLEDYAFLIQGLIDLYEASFETRWLSWAIRLQAQQDALFWDKEGGGYFSTRAGASHVLVRMKDDYDGAEPSSNLWQMTDRQDLRDKADAIFLALADRLGSQGAAVPQLAAALDFSLSKPKQIIIAGELGAPDTRAMLRLVHERFIPNKILLLADGGAAQRKLTEWLPFIKEVRRQDSRATAYICENYVCQLPTADLDVVARLLGGARRPGSSR